MQTVLTVQLVALIPEYFAFSLQVQNHVRLASQLHMCAFMMQSLLLDTPSTTFQVTPSNPTYLNVFPSPYLAAESSVYDSWVVYASELTQVSLQRLRAISLIF